MSIQSNRSASRSANRFATASDDLDLEALIAEIDRTDYAPRNARFVSNDLTPISGRRVPAYAMAA